MENPKQRGTGESRRDTQEEPNEKPDGKGLVQAIRESPLAEAIARDGLDLSRDRDCGRDVPL